MKKFYLVLILLSLILTTALKPASSVNDNGIILTWSSSSFAPAWYPGKPLPSSGSQITVSASPEILLRDTNLKPQDLIYRWFLDYRLQSSASGRGQQDFSFIASGGKGTVINIKVEIQNSAGVLLGKKSLKITLAEPIVQIHHLFENQFIGTAFKNAVDIPPGQNISFIAIPYFFNVANREQFNFFWYTNNEPVSINPAKRPDITHLEINPEIPLGSIYDLEVIIKNKFKEKESASNFLRITVK